MLTKAITAESYLTDFNTSFLSTASATYNTILKSGNKPREGKMQYSSRLVFHHTKEGHLVALFPSNSNAAFLPTATQTIRTRQSTDALLSNASTQPMDAVNLVTQRNVPTTRGTVTQALAREVRRDEPNVICFLSAALPRQDCYRFSAASIGWVPVGCQ